MRYASIDILRTLAIFVMVMVHFGENLAGYTVPFAGFGAPLFAFLSGASYWLWAENQQRRGKSDEEISKISIRRGLFVFGVGIAFNILIWFPEDTFNWDVLTLIGAALVVLNFARRLPPTVPAFAAVLAILLSPVLRHIADYDSYWTNGYYDYDYSLTDLFLGFFAVGYFPILPWIAFSLSGLVTASLLFADVDESSTVDAAPPMRAIRFLLALGAVLVALAVAGLLMSPSLPTLAQSLLGGWTMFPPALPYVLGTLGCTLILFGLLHRYVDCNPRRQRYARLLDIAKTFSQYSFTIYIVHHVVHLWPLWIYSLATGNEPTALWQQAMPATVALPLGLLFMATAYVLLRWIGPDRNLGIEACMRWLCD
jgi:hypothetical protein